MADARLVHFDPEIQAARIVTRHVNQGIPVTYADFQLERSEAVGQLRHTLLKINTVQRPVAVDCLVLGWGQAPAAAHETADRTMPGVVNGHGLAGFSWNR